MDLETLLLPHWAALKRQTFFDRLAPELQARALADALASSHPDEAREVREWTPPTRRTLLARLDSCLRPGHVRPQRLVWTARKGERREVVCVAVSLSYGTELRLMEQGEMLRSELLRDEFLVAAKAEEWLRALLSAGWRACASGDAAGGPAATRERLPSGL